MSVVAIALRATVLNYDDFESYAAAVGRALAGEPIYAARQLTGPYHLQELTAGNGFIYPPTAVPLLLPSALGTAAGFVLLLVGVSLLAYVVAEVIRRELPNSGPLPFAVSGLILLSPAAGDAIYVAQITPYVAAGYGLSWAAPRAAMWVAVFGGLLKVFPAALLVWGLRERRLSLAPIALGASVVLATTLWLGAAAWPDFVLAWRNAQPQCDGPSMGSLWCAFGDAGRLFGVIAAILIGGVCWVLPWRSITFAGIGVASIIAAPDIFPNYLLIVTVAFIPAFCRLATSLPGSWFRSPAEATDGH
jgi:hypothetical protein